MNDANNFENLCEICETVKLLCIIILILYYFYAGRKVFHEQNNPCIIELNLHFLVDVPFAQHFTDVRFILWLFRILTTSGLVGDAVLQNPICFFCSNICVRTSLYCMHLHLGVAVLERDFA